ncbi:MAG TPA: TetR/AcrR family transcriptional regulator C-terminal domain-containing protein [Chloroflexota bacterium]|jgi:AcrR family transcriptional regulator
MPDAGQSLLRERILDAAFGAFADAGYAQTSTLEIATRARVSKRELYALVGSKQDLLLACITERAKRLQAPVDLPVPTDRETLAEVLSTFGSQLLRETTDPTVIAVFRLAIAEAGRTPEIGRVLDSVGSETTRAALRTIMQHATARGLVSGRPAVMARQFAGLLWGDLMIGLLLQVVERPTAREVARRARDATTAFLEIYE